MNKFKFEIIGIYHSGRKGVRWQEVSDAKYDGLVGCLTTFNPDEVERFEGIRFYLKNHPRYKWWDTTGIIQLARGIDGSYVLETVNTIYVFDEVKAE